MEASQSIVYLPTGHISLLGRQRWRRRLISLIGRRWMDLIAREAKVEVDLAIGEV
jgi:hypothetical protein